MSDTTKRKRQDWKERDMKLALENIKNKNMGWKLASKIFNVPSTTLRRRYKNNKGAEKGDLGGRRPTFDVNLEEKLVSHILEMETRFFGLTTKDLRSLAFLIAEKNSIPHSFNKEISMAGWKWVRGFLKRNPRISLRTPENTSLARAQAFNKNNIALYFNKLSAVIEKYNFTPENLFNMDESSLSTVQSRPQKIFANKGRKQVGTLSSSERGQHLTVVCSMNAIGTFVPPVFIFPRKRFKNELMDNVLPGSIAFCQDNGWMSGEIFFEWLKHFVHYVKPSNDNKVLLLLDGHSSHKNFEALEYAKSNGIVLFCFPAHCTHRVQPLDVGFFGPLQIYYDQEIQLWMKQNPGRLVTHYQVASLFTKAYLKTATPSNAINAFIKTGIYPFNAGIFEDWMFAPSLTTDQKENKAENNNMNVEKCDISAPSTSTNNLLVTIEELLPVPVAPIKQNTNRGRKKGKVGILNTTPEIKDLKKEKEEKLTKERQKLARKVKRHITYEVVKDLESEELMDNDESDVACLYCNELYSRSKPNEFWIRCQKCNVWCHVECAGVGRRTKTYICEICN